MTDEELVNMVSDLIEENLRQAHRSDLWNVSLSVPERTERVESLWIDALDAGLSASRINQILGEENESAKQTRKKMMDAS